MLRDLKTLAPSIVKQPISCAPRKEATMFRRFVKDERGSIGTLLALGALTMLGAVSAGVDYSRMVTTRTELANAVDAAALAGGQANAAQAAVVARNVFDANFRNQASVVSFRAEPFTRGEEEGYRVTAVASVDMALAQTLGFSSAPVRAFSEVAASGSDADMLVSLVLDTTGSMDGAKLTSLKSSATRMVNDLFTRFKRPNQVKVAVVPFALYVNVGLGNRNASWIQGAQDTTFGFWRSTWHGCVGSRSFPLNVRDENYGIRVPAIMNETCARPLLPLTANRTAVVNAITALSASGSTYIPAGLMWGWATVSPREPFNEPTDPQNTTKRFVVLMTDGENTATPTYPEHDGGREGTLANSLTSQICANIKNDGIEVFTIAFEVDTSTVKSLLRNCASSPDRFYDAANSTQLASAFTGIVRQMSSLRIVR